MIRRLWKLSKFLFFPFFSPFNYFQLLFGYAFFDPCKDHLQKIWGSPNVQWSWSLYSDRRPCHTATSTFGVHCDGCPLMPRSLNLQSFLSPSSYKKQMVSFAAGAVLKPCCLPYAWCRRRSLPWGWKEKKGSAIFWHPIASNEINGASSWLF